VRPGHRLRSPARFRRMEPQRPVQQP